MKTLKHYFEEILRDKEKWKYYNCNEIDEKLEDILNKPEKFITFYLKAGDKLPPEVTNIIDNLSIERLQHTISIFFLGLLLYSGIPQIKQPIDLFIKKKRKDIESEEYPNIDFPFCYNWFLICFFHDIGYSFKKKSNLKIFEKSEIKDIKNEVISILKAYPCNDSIPKEISKSWRNYLKFKETHTDQEINEEIDHGILAGAYFYYMLKNIYKQKKWKYENREEFLDEAGLFWSEKMLERVHKPIAWIIVAHNIWYKNKITNCKQEIEEYEENCLSDLIISKPILNLNKYPLYFLLSLVDTLDPIKFINNAQSENTETIKINETLKNIYLDIKDNKLEITFKDSLNSQNEYFIKNNKKIINWIDLLVETKQEQLRKIFVVRFTRFLPNP